MVIMTSSRELRGGRGGSFGGGSSWLSSNKEDSDGVPDGCRQKYDNVFNEEYGEIEKVKLEGEYDCSESVGELIILIVFGVIGVLSCIICVGYCVLACMDGKICGCCFKQKDVFR